MIQKLGMQSKEDTKLIPWSIETLVYINLNSPFYVSGEVPSNKPVLLQVPPSVEASL